jgi:hypothetical protein
MTFDGDIGATMYNLLLGHEGHDIVCVRYGNEHEPALNMAIECETCGVVLVDADQPQAQD